MMTRFEIARQRLVNQQIANPTFREPGDVVRWMGAVQAQDYAAAKWAVAQRTKGITEAVIERAFADGAILRTHLLRPTWHFVTPTDIRWMLALTAPRINAANAHPYRNLGLDDATFARSNAALAKALQGGMTLDRSELESVLKQARIVTDDLRFTYLIMRAELDGIVCSGGRRGKQFTYALLDERAPQAKPLERDDALAALAKRYYSSRGPATLQDFAWWSGLTVTDARKGLEMIQPEFLHEVVEGQTFWFTASARLKKDSTAYLLPNFDEYTVGYKDRRAVFDTAHFKKLGFGGLLDHTIVIDGQVVGIWRRTLKKDAVVVELKPFASLTKAQSHAVAMAAQRYGAFLDLPVVLA